MSTLSVDSINGQTVASKVSIPGHIVGAAVSQITANSSRATAQAQLLYRVLPTLTVIIQDTVDTDGSLMVQIFFQQELQLQYTLINFIVIHQ